MDWDLIDDMDKEIEQTKAKKYDILKQLSNIYEEYIKLLEEEITNMASVAIMHGWQSTSAKIKKGEELRNKINELKNKL